MISVRQWDHAVLPARDLWRAERWYSAVLGGAIFMQIGLTSEDIRVPAGCFIKIGRQHIGLFLQAEAVTPPDDASACPRWAFSIPAGLWEEALRQASRLGSALGSERKERFNNQDCFVVDVRDSEGNPLELVRDEHGTAPALSHFHSESTDLDQTARFYGRYLGASVLARSDRRLTLGWQSGQACIVEKRERLSSWQPHEYRGRHFAFHVDDATWRDIVGLLRADGVAEGDVLARQSQAVGAPSSTPGGGAQHHERGGRELATYFVDPNGLRLQILNIDSDTAAGTEPLIRLVEVSRS